MLRICCMNACMHVWADQAQAGFPQGVCRIQLKSGLGCHSRPATDLESAARGHPQLAAQRVHLDFLSRVDRNLHAQALFRLPSTIFRSAMQQACGRMRSGVLQAVSALLVGGVQARIPAQTHDDAGHVMCKRGPPADAKTCISPVADALHSSRLSALQPQLSSKGGTWPSSRTERSWGVGGADWGVLGPISDQLRVGVPVSALPAVCLL